MPDGLVLFSVCLLTVVGTRLGVWLIPEVDITLFRTTIHHFWLGLFFVILSYPFAILNHLLGVVALGCGLGLVADELTFMLRGGGHDTQYWEASSLVGTIILLIIIFYLRATLASALH